MGGSVTVEVKFSKLKHTSRASVAGAGTGANPRLERQGESFDFLVLVGEKDMRYPNQYRTMRRTCSS